MKNAFDLAGRRILVTGAAAGIGAETAQVCAGLGAHVVLVDQAAATATLGAIRAAGGQADLHRLDVTDRCAVETLAAEAAPVDALVLNAAICPFDDWTDEGWDDVFHRVVDVNVLGPIHFARAFLPGMCERGEGRIVLVGSVAGRVGGLIAAPHYVASKGALHALVKWLAKRGGPHGVTVNGIAPASVETEMIAGQPVDTDAIPLRRKARAEEIAWPVAFLCSDAASYVCGTVLDVNGGVYMN